MNSGIYKITCLITGKSYVGSAKHFDNRWYSHEFDLNKNKHYNKHLQNSWNKHGAENFEFSAIEFCEYSKLIEREQYWIDTLNPEYNICLIAGSALGTKRSPEVKAKMSAWQIGRKMSDDAKIKMSLAKIGKPNVANRGRKLTEEHKQKMSLARKGTKLSEEHKEKIRLKSIGNKSKTGMKNSEETRLKMSKSSAKRNRSRWPHADGYYCKCEECRNKIREYVNNKAKEYRNNKYVEYVMVTT